MKHDRSKSADEITFALEKDELFSCVKARDAATI
jgi:hypothetical protein